MSSNDLFSPVGWAALDTLIAPSAPGVPERLWRAIKMDIAALPPQEALCLTESIVCRYPLDYRVYYAIGVLRVALKMYEAAKNDLRTAENLMPVNVHLLGKLMYGYYCAKSAADVVRVKYKIKSLPDGQAVYIRVEKAIVGEDLGV